MSRAEKTSVPSLFDGRMLPLGKALLCSSSVSEDEGQDVKDKRQKRGSGVYYDLLHPTQTHSPSSHFSRPLFHIPAPSFKLILSLLDFSPPFCPPPPPPTLQSRAFGCQWDQATARCMSMEKNGWLIQSSLLFLRQCRVISSTAKAF